MRACTFVLFYLVSFVTAKQTVAAEHTNGTRQAAPSQAAVAIPTGTVIPELPSSGATDQTYALYLAASYSPARRWPIIHVFAPGAWSYSRSAEANDGLSPVAEGFGYSDSRKLGSN